MRKIISGILLLAFSLGAAAQSLPSFEELKDKAEAHSRQVKEIDFVLLDYIGYGFHGIYDADPLFGEHTAFLRNREIYFNLAGLVLRPLASEHHAITLGVDLDWDNYRLDPGHMWVPEGQAVRIVPIAEEGIKSVGRSILRVLSFDIPLDYTLSSDSFAVTIGAAAQISLPGRTRFVGNDLNDSEIRNLKSGPYRATDIRTNKVTWNAHAQITFDHFGIYGKFSPQPVFQDGYGPQFPTWTVGLILR